MNEEAKEQEHLREVRQRALELAVRSSPEGQTTLGLIRSAEALADYILSGTTPI